MKTSKSKPKPETVKPVGETHTAMSIERPSTFSLDKFKTRRAATVAGVETLQTGLPLACACDFILKVVEQFGKPATPVTFRDTKQVTQLRRVGGEGARRAFPNLICKRSCKENCHEHLAQRAFLKRISKPSSAAAIASSAVMLVI
jgi:hypothetical protein